MKKTLLSALTAMIGFGAQAAPAAPAPKPEPRIIDSETFKAEIVRLQNEAATMTGFRRTCVLQYDRTANARELAEMAEKMGCEVHHFLLYVDIAFTNGPTHEDMRD